MYWLRWHYHVKDIAGASYKIKKKSKQKWQNRRQSVVAGRQQLYCAVQSRSPDHVCILILCVEIQLPQLGWSLVHLRYLHQAVLCLRMARFSWQWSVLLSKQDISPRLTTLCTDTSYVSVCLSVYLPVCSLPACLCKLTSHFDNHKEKRIKFAD